jgi:DNA polymerase I
LKSLLIDYEYNNMSSAKATKVWCAAAIDLQTLKRYSWRPKGIGPDAFHVDWEEEHVEFLKQYDHFVGHHFWGAEAKIMSNIFGITLRTDQVTDTLVLSRTLRPVSPQVERFGEFQRKGWDNRVGGHSLEAWGQRLGYPKIEFDKFDEFTEPMLTYCERDVEVNLRMLDKLNEEIAQFGFSEDSLRIEHESSRILCEQSFAGFTLEKTRAKKLVEDTDKLLQEYKDELFKIFPPKKKLIEVYTAKTTKAGEMTAAGKKKLLRQMHEDNGDGTYNIYTMQEFNPDSPAQVGDRLVDLGWNPRKYTATGQPSTSKDVIGEAIEQLAERYPEVEVLRKYNIVGDRNQKARKWLDLAVDDGRVHGKVNHVGPWTHRCSHFDDNMANISRVKLNKENKPLEGLAGDYGWDSRHCWIARDGWKLVGVDAAGIQLRALAHYMGDEDYIKQVCEGDIHVVNQKAAGIKDRPTSKTFIYAWLLGAGDEKIGLIVGAPVEEHEALFARAQSEFRWNKWRHKDKKEGRGQFDTLLHWVADKLRSDGRVADRQTVATILKGHFTKRQFLEALPPLAKFRTEVIPSAASDGYMLGLDGRKIWVPSEHLAMGAYLQGFEAVIMKWAMHLYHAKLQSEGVPFQQVAFVHDEFQIETPPEYADKVGNTVVWSIEEAGRLLKSKCPLTGEFRVGTSWAETH